MKMAEKASENAPLADSLEDATTVSTDVRQQLVETAVKFLQNPKVMRSPLSEKKAFLASKGLTTVEIETAVQMAGNLTQDLDPKNRLAGLPQNVEMYNNYPVRYTLSVIREYCATIVFIGGAAYGFYHLIKKYLMPYLTGVPTEEDRIAKLESQVTEFHSSLTDVMSQVRDMITELQITLHQINRKSEARAATPDNFLENQFADLRYELKSLKGLLLNRHQFPATPSIAPIIPTWQLASDEQTVVESKADANYEDRHIAAPDEVNFK